MRDGAQGADKLSKVNRAALILVEDVEYVVEKIVLVAGRGVLEYSPEPGLV
jgi:hypothetical protein